MITPANKENWLVPICNVSYLFFCPIAWQNFFMPYWIREMRWYPCTASDLDAFSVMPCAFLYTIFIMCISDITSLFLNFQHFYHMAILHFIRCSSVSIEMIRRFLSFVILICVCWTLLDGNQLNHAEMFFDVLLNWIASVLLRISASVFIRDIGYSLLHPSPLCLPPFIYSLFFFLLSCPCLILESRLCWPHRIILERLSAFNSVEGLALVL